VGRASSSTTSRARTADYTNYNLNGVKLSEFAPEPGVILPAAQEYSASPATKTQEDRDVSIARAVALKAAVETTGPDEPESILAVAGIYVDWLLTGAVVGASVDTPVADVVKF
jgi:hypothetical protein